MRWPLAVKRLHVEAKVPAYQTNGSAGLDLHACLDEPIEIPVGQILRISCGIAIEIPIDHEGQIRSRSGLALNGITVAHGVGTVDCDYRGELGVILLNNGDSPFIVEHGDRIAQLVISPVARVDPFIADDLTPTARGVKGFGSTGI